MSTSETVYNLTKKTRYYLDRAYWLTTIDSERLYTSSELHNRALDAMEDLDDRGRWWIEGLLEWVRANPKCAFIVLTDTSNWDLFEDFDLVNK